MTDTPTALAVAIRARDIKRREAEEHGEAVIQRYLSDSTILCSTDTLVWLRTLRAPARGEA